MKKFFCLFIMIFCAVNITNAQKHSEFKNNNFRLGVGPYIGYKLGINAAEVSTGYKNGVNAANMPDFGVQFYIPFEGKSSMGLIISGAYVTNPYKLTSDGAGISNDFKYNFSYLALGADFYLSGFTIGFNFGFPSSAKMEIGGKTEDKSTDLLANMFEFKIGGHIAMMENDMGRLNLVIQAGYFISGQYNDDRAIKGKNTNPTSLMVGVSYLFNIDDKED